ncbi:hypothetical protein [Mycolicibacterium sphagni]|uniref:hypothetical protein n=1 Tax=Mycolicibacterium sphagni TaxID=1786 RepID=UPI0021F2FFAC|nr:hypothetical protein [Mycolicibacterium sphagni]MCV7177897.1 hypothetical protein [Mycolicibacterium sphagni]
MFDYAIAGRHVSMPVDPLIVTNGLPAADIPAGTENMSAVHVKSKPRQPGKAFEYFAAATA